MNIDERLKDSAPRLRDTVDRFALPETVATGPRPKRWRIAVAVAVAAVISIGIIAVALQRDPSSKRKPVTTPNAVQQYSIDATLLQSPGQPAQLCVGAVFASRPPQCSGAEVLGLDWATAPDPQTEAGVTWGVYRVVGTYDDAKFTFTLTQPPVVVPTHRPTSSTERFKTPCATPPGGWKNDNPSKMSLASYQAMTSSVRTQPDFAGMWLDSSTPVDGRREQITNQVVTLAFTGNLAEHRAAIAQIWGGAVCVVQHARSRSELDAIAQAVQGPFASELGLRVVGGAFVDDVENSISPLDVMLALPAAQRALDRRFGDGVVQLHQVLEPVDAEVQKSPETWTVHEDQANGLSMRVAPGWRLSSGPLRPWLASPHELLSAATVPLTPSPRPGNQAACPSEVAQVVVDQIGRDGGYFSLDEGFTGGPRPDRAADLDWRPGCSLPQGMHVEIATFTDAQRDFVVTAVFGPNASRALRDDLYAMLDSLEVRCTSRPVC